MYVYVVWLYVCMAICMYGYMYVWLYVCMAMYVWLYVCMAMHTIHISTKHITSKSALTFRLATKYQVFDDIFNALQFLHIPTTVLHVFMVPINAFLFAFTQLWFFFDLVRTSVSFLSPPSFSAMHP